MTVALLILKNYEFFAYKETKKHKDKLHIHQMTVMINSLSLFLRIFNTQ